MSRCPFIEFPSERCYVTKLDSRSAERAIAYCGGDYEGCSIYENLIAVRQQGKDRAGEAHRPPLVPSTGSMDGNPWSETDGRKEKS
jgi:hypothetical protein